MIINKVDPLLLDELKYAFLDEAGRRDPVTINRDELRDIVKRVINTDKQRYEERFAQALGAKDEINVSIDFSDF